MIAKNKTSAYVVNSDMEGGGRLRKRFLRIHASERSVPVTKEGAVAEYNTWYKNIIGC
jgi:hypothetical protein